MKGIKIFIPGKHVEALWGLVDGVADAGACDGGNTPVEQEAAAEFSGKLLAHMATERRKRKEQSDG